MPPLKKTKRRIVTTSERDLWYLLDILSMLVSVHVYKVCIAGETNQTMKHKLYKYFTENATTNYVDILLDITFFLQKHWTKEIS